MCCLDLTLVTVGEAWSNSQWDGGGQLIRTRPHGGDRAQRLRRLTALQDLRYEEVFARHLTSPLSLLSLSNTSGCWRTTVELTLERRRTFVRTRPHGGDRAQTLRCLVALPEGRSIRALLHSVDDFGHPEGTIDPDAIRCAGFFFSAHHPRSRRCNPAGLFGVR